MTVNLATKYAAAALDKFALGSLTEGVFSAKYDWTGAHTVTVFSNATTALNDYARTGSARYGTVADIGNTKQDMAVAKARSFAAALDGLDVDETGGSLNAGAFLKQEIEQVIVPDVDGYRFAALFTACPTGQISATAAITTANAYSAFLTSNALLDEAGVPEVGRVCFASPAYLNLLKMDANYVKASDLAVGQIMFKGQVGEIDGVPVIKVPSTRLNATDNHIDYMIVHKDAVAAPIKLNEFYVHSAANGNKAPGISGDLVEGLVAHDCFLLTALNKGIAIHIHA